MSTPNFSCTNASKIYAFGGAKYFDKETIEANEYPREWLGTFDECRTENDYYFALECCGDILAREGWDAINENDGDRSYPTHFFAEKTVLLTVSGIEAEITAKAGVTAGYYDGACFDWAAGLKVYGNSGEYVGEYDLTGGYSVDAETVVADEWIENRGLCKIQAKNVVKRIYAALGELVAECEAAFEECSEHRLACIGIGGNGEGFYVDLDTERGRLKAAAC